MSLWSTLEELEPQALGLVGW